MIRPVIEIDEALCDGCGRCIPGCAEGAIALVDGKARLLSESVCDGLGACLGECPRGAISVVEREAASFDAAAVARLAPPGTPSLPALRALRPAGAPPAGAACPGAAPRVLPRRGLSIVRDPPTAPPAPSPRQGGSALGHWPVQLRLVPPGAPWLAGADLLVAADCVPFAYAGFHADFLEGRAVVVGCPKLDDNQAHAARLAEIFAQGRPRSVTVIRMEVPCCGGIAWAVREGIARSGGALAVRDVVIGVDGAIRSDG